MPRFTDPAEIRSLLETDRPWAAYALGDLVPGLFEHTEWFRGRGEAPSLALVYRAFSIPVLFTLGDARGVEVILAEIDSEPAFYLSVRPEILPLMKVRYRVSEETAMWRMILEPGRFQPAAEGAARLRPVDLEALQRLYADGEPVGEAPGFFTPSMLEQGVYCGVWENGELVAAAGTHLVAPAEGVGAIGNVYTRRDRRGRGLAARATGAVSAELVRLGLPTVALNVSQANAAAIRAYERVGFVRYCAFYEGVAELEKPVEEERRRTGNQ